MRIGQRREQTAAERQGLGDSLADDCHDSRPAYQKVEPAKLMVHLDGEIQRAEELLLDRTSMDSVENGECLGGHSKALRR